MVTACKLGEAAAVKP